MGEVQECMDPVEYFNGNLLQHLQYILNKIEKVDWLLRQLPTTLAWRDIKKYLVNNTSPLLKVK